ncbi:ABC transporter substrate-binding protein [Pseudogracilibacillus auburnensis]|uniref:ABC transporter substrate-binding protein n=1 Tax=Pseudogracilibacillus auburnensis TaxID=1494959 RepID=UPI001A977B0F|nr:ABC transporter substrate-binding protein [Pseudogracilibacillus auburnensis]MBO1001733.1 ABC transporter substrate-binding protein [Pseudogracilibacillus auburnensis]
MKRLLQLSLTLLLSMLLIACSSEQVDKEETEVKTDETAKKEVSLFLDWTPNTNHTGIYVAKEKGYYDELGLDINILLPGEVSAEQLVATNKGEFGISFQTEVTQARAQDLPVVSVAAIIQHSTSGYASPIEKGIESPKDFAGKAYGAYGSMLEESMVDLVMKRDGADVKDVDIVQLGNSDFFVATQKDIDFVSIFYAWTGIEAEIRDVELNFIETTQFAEELDTYSPVIVTSEKLIAEDPETVKAFVEATVKGYEYAIDNPAEAAEILINAEPDLDPELVKRSQEWLSPRYQDDADKWGIQDENRWETFAEFMFENGITEKEIDATKAFTNEFLE